MCLARAVFLAGPVSAALCCVVRFGGVLDDRSIGADGGATGVSSVRQTLYRDRRVTLKQSPGFGTRALRSTVIYMLRLTM